MKNIIKFKRKELGVSQSELAHLCNVSRQTINAIENNKYDPTLQLAFKISEVLKTRIDILFLFEQENIYE